MADGSRRRPLLDSAGMRRIEHAGLSSGEEEEGLGLKVSGFRRSGGDQSSGRRRVLVLEIWAAQHLCGPLL